jgi:hypothetical protein
MVERDAAICRAYEIGFHASDIGRAFSLSGTRIRQILKKHEVPPRSPCIPALVWYDDPAIFESSDGAMNARP